MKVIKDLINSLSFEEAYLAHLKYQNLNGWKHTEVLNKSLKRDCGDKYIQWRDWLLVTKFTKNQPNNASHYLEQLLMSNFMDKTQLTKALQELGLPLSWVRNKADGQLFTLPDPHQPANKVMYASTTRIMEQGYEHTLTYHPDKVCIGWWRGVDVSDLTDEHRRVLNAALELINADVVNNTTHNQLKTHHYYRWLTNNISLTLIRVDKQMADFWRTGV